MNDNVTDATAEPLAPETPTESEPKLAAVVHWGDCGFTFTDPRANVTADDLKRS